MTEVVKICADLARRSHAEPVTTENHVPEHRPPWNGLEFIRGGPSAKWGDIEDGIDIEALQADSPRPG